MSNDFEGKVAVVTGAAKGIGLTISEELARRGATVVVSDLDGSAAQAAADGLQGSGHEGVECDVRDEEHVTRLLTGAKERHGSLDVVVGNAGVGSVQPLAEMSLADWRAVTSINLDGVFLSSKIAGGIMAEQGSGAIVNIASITGLTGAPGIGHYAAAKAGVISISKTLNSELRAYGVRVNCVCPGFIRTDLVKDAESDFDALLPEGMTLDDVVTTKQSRWGDPQDVAAAVCFLAGPRASWIGGAAPVLDGGWRASLL